MIIFKKFEFVQISFRSD